MHLIEMFKMGRFYCSETTFQLCSGLTHNKKAIKLQSVVCLKVKLKSVNLTTLVYWWLSCLDVEVFEPMCPQGTLYNDYYLPSNNSLTVFESLSASSLSCFSNSLDFWSSALAPAPILSSSRSSRSSRNEILTVLCDG